MKKLIIIGIVVVVLVGGIFGGTALAARPAAAPAMSPVMMDGGSANLTMGFHMAGPPQFVSPEYDQMRHISVTLWADSCDMDQYDNIYVRAYFDKSDGSIAKIVVLEFTDCDFRPIIIEFDARQWEIEGCDGNNSGAFEAYVNYTMTYPVVD